MRHTRGAQLNNTNTHGTPPPHLAPPPPITPHAALDASEGQRQRAAATPAAAELEAVYDLTHKLACVAQSFAASPATPADVRALQKQLRRLKAEAAQALGAAGGSGGGGLAGLPAL